MELLDFENMLKYSTQNSATIGVTFKVLEQTFRRENFEIKNVKTPKKSSFWTGPGHYFRFIQNNLNISIVRM